MHSARHQRTKDTKISAPKSFRHIACGFANKNLPIKSPAWTKPQGRPNSSRLPPRNPPRP
jgi:hypothetical protein